MKRRFLPLSLLLSLLLTAVSVAPASAHRPYFEEEDIVAGSPWRITDPTISTVVYATLEAPGDVDYYAFEGQAGQRILLEITIPQIEGQADFAPTLALIGPGLPATQLPASVEGPVDSGALVLEPPQGPAATFFEPFSRTS